LGLYLNAELGKKPVVLKYLYLFTVSQLFLVGLIPYGHSDILNQVHYFAGNIIFIMIGATMLLLPVIMLGEKRIFYVINYLFLAFGVLFYLLCNNVHYFSITFYELNSIILIIIWSIYIIRHLETEKDGSPPHN
jgi:hypothetical protein